MANISPEYKLSVRLMTYMHEPFIKQAMNVIMMQKTDFKIEVVVGDDFSTDQTLEIIKSYKNTESIDVKILKREKGDEYWQKRQKLGRVYNFSNISENCIGKYIDLLDVDDYWKDPLKLQKQVDF
jgi:glycosyltransferase involved in cell wall biosynthesis